MSDGKIVVLMLRVSTKEQADSRLGLESQETLGRAAIQREMPGAEVIVLSEEGVSGSVPLAERPEGRKLTDLIATKRVAAVFALTQDRLFRSMIDALATLDRWSELGVRLFLVDGGWIDLSDDGEWTKFVIQAFAAELERRNVRKRTKRALRAATERGKRVGGVPYGLKTRARIVEGRKVDAGVYDPVPEHMAVIEKVRLYHAEEGSLRKTAARLRSEAIPTQRGGTWSGEQVRKIVRRAS